MPENSAETPTAVETVQLYLPTVSRCYVLPLFTESPRGVLISPVWQIGNQSSQK